MKTFNFLNEKRKVIVIVNGYPRSGKDTFVDFAGEYFTRLGWKAYAMSSIDFIKKITSDNGISEEPKTPEKRALWADLKAAFEKYDRLVSRKTMARMQDQMFACPREKQIGFIHVREPDSITFMKTLATDEFVTIFIDRLAAERVTSNTSDMEVENFTYDHIIQNNSDLDALKLIAQRFAHEIVAANGARQ